MGESNTFSKSKELKELIENKFGKYIKVLSSYGGGEYDSHEFLCFYKQHGIEH